MTTPQKKIIPKFKKKFRGFLSDESGKITREDVLKIGMLSMGIGGMASEANANTYSCSHGNSVGIAGSSFGTLGTITSNAWGQIVNGHANAAPGTVGVNGSAGHSNSQYGTHSNAVSLDHANHSNHASHASHGSHGSHASY